MNCETCQLELEDLIYGELSSRRAQEVRAHLADCSECRQHRLELEREQTIFADYHDRTSREPGAELWASIRERIRDESKSSVSRIDVMSERQTRWSLFGWLPGPVVLRQLLGASALVVLTVLATVYLIQRRQPSPQEVARKSTPSPAIPDSTPGQDVAKVNVADAVKSPSPASSTVRKTVVAPTTTKTLSDEELIQQQLRRTEREYVAAIRMLDQAIVKRKGSIDGEVYRQYETSLALIDDSIDKSRQALRARAGDPVAGQFLLAAYARKVELMQEIALR